MYQNMISMAIWISELWSFAFIKCLHCVFSVLNLGFQFCLWYTFLFMFHVLVSRFCTVRPDICVTSTSRCLLLHFHDSICMCFGPSSNTIVNVPLPLIDRKGGYYNGSLFNQHGVAILEDLLIMLADGIASMYLELISMDSSLSNEMNNLGLSFCTLSTRALQRLRNEVWLYLSFYFLVSFWFGCHSCAALSIRMSFTVPNLHFT